MPLYEYRCLAGHAYDALRPRDADADACACGRVATRLSVNRVSFNQKGGLASEFVMPSSMRAAHEEAKGYAAEVRAIAAEERANGFQ